MSKLDAAVLVVDDDADVLHTARFILKNEFKKVTVESNPEQLSYLIKNHPFDVILLDMNYRAGVTSGKEGLRWLKQIASMENAPQVVMMTAYGDIKLAVEAMKIGAADFVVKPWENEKLLATITSAYRYNQSKKQIEKLKRTQIELNEHLTPKETLVGSSIAMKEVLQIAEKVAQTDAGVLILGENGTGKEVIARHIHYRSARRHAPFIKVDLGAVADHLFESELFGHIKGAFTDAKSDKTGRLALAGEGTLFLDEIGNLSLSLQAKLLSVLQNKEVIPVGGVKTQPINARILAATNEHLLTKVRLGTFREDLLYRLNTVEITVPPLRERIEDIEPLASHFLAIYKARYRKEVRFDIDVIEMLKRNPWSGNVRELMHTIERAVIMAEDEVLKKGDFIIKNTPEPTVKTLNLDENEKYIIQQALTKHNGNVSKAAKELGLGRTTIYRKLDKYNIHY